MHRFLAKLFLILMLTLFIALPKASAMPEIFPLDQVKGGMNGKAYTVVDSSGKIEQFSVNIVGVTNDGKGSKRMIMARASGDVIQRTGGILQGMSGSPVYIDGKLVGAVASVFKDMDPHMFLITPIKDMIELWNLPDPKAQVNYLKIVKDIEAKEKAAAKVDDAKSDDKADAETSIDAETADKPAQDDNQTQELGAVYFDGFGTTGANFLSRELRPLGLKNLAEAPASTDRGIDLNATLEPGSALGVALIYGDFTLGATGTVTAVDGKRILAFGHSFMHAGNVNYFMTEASVIGSISGVTSNGVKLSGLGHIIGRINQDRDSGISGILGTFPAVVPITISIHDNSLDKEETYNVAIAYNENLIPKLGAVVTYAALSRMADSLAESTVDIDFNIKTDSIESGEIARKNMFYNASDVGQVAVLELMQALNLVCSNTKEESNIFGVDVNIAFDAQRRTASIVSITPDRKRVKPGETVNLTVELQPYRRPTEKVVLPYTVPLTARQGNLALEVHGGSLVQVNQSTAMANSGLITADSNRSYEDKIKDFLKTGKNNQLVVEIGASNEVKSDKQLRAEIAQVKRIQARLKKEGKSVTKSDNRVDTNYIIDNVMRTTLSVEKV